MTFATLHTNKGDIRIELFDNHAPKTVKNFIELAEGLISDLPWIKYVNARQRGYAVVDLTGDRMQAEYRVIADVTDPESSVSTATIYTVDAVPAAEACPVAETEQDPATGGLNTQPVSPQFTG